MATKQTPMADSGKKKQEKVTFQPDPGLMDTVDKALAADFFGPKRSRSFVMNHYLRQGLERDGFLPKPKK